MVGKEANGSRHVVYPCAPICRNVITRNQSTDLENEVIVNRSSREGEEMNKSLIVKFTVQEFLCLVLVLIEYQESRIILAKDLA